MSSIATEWRWAVFLAVCVIAVAIVSFARRRRRPSIASMPSSFFGRRQSATQAQEIDEPQGPEGGRVIRLDGLPPPVPTGSAVSSDEHPFPPIGEIGAHQPPLPPRQDELIVTIDLTELEDEQLEEEPRVIDFTVESAMVALPADPWG